MKALIVYYSMGGNTEYAARKIAEQAGAETLRLEPVKAYPDSGFRKFFWGGKSAVMAEKPKLKPYEFNADAYDTLIFGFPVWAANIAPPIRSFICENKEALAGKRIAAFACQSGSGGGKAFRKLLECLGQDSLAAAMILIDPKDKPREENDRMIGEFRDQLG